MPFTLPTIYALRAVSVKNVSQRLSFIGNLYKFKGSFILLTIGSKFVNPNYTNSNCNPIDKGLIY